LARVKDKTVVITGASRGIGREAAIALGKMGAKLVLVVRDGELGRAVASEAGGAQVVVADLSSMAEVRRAADEIAAGHASIDVLLNNAGAIIMERRVTVDGYEATFATNHLAYFLLTKRLRPALEKAPSARVVSVASEAHRGGHIAFDDLMREKSYVGFRVYAQSKLANILFSSELARRLDGTRVTSNAVHPGVVASNFGLGDAGLIRWFYKFGAPFLKSPANGAKTSIFLASSPAVEGVTGKYWKNERETTPAREARDPEVARRLWDASEELVSRWS
jgi:retinol dehydrogenase 12